MQKFRVTPQMLNRFSKYLNGVEGLDDFDGLIEYFNNGPGPEESHCDATTNLFKESVFGKDFTSLSAKDAKALLPAVGQRNMPFHYDFDGLRITGSIDFMGFGMGVMIEVVENYKIPHYLKNHNNWILLSWDAPMFKRLDYLTSTRDGVCRETYTKGTYNFGCIMDEAAQLKLFLNEYRDLITNNFILSY